MVTHDLFHTEMKVIENARKTLEQGRIAVGSSAEEYERLLEKYTKLFKQARRLIKFSDRMQNDLNRLNRRLYYSEVKYRNIFENAIEGIFRSDPSGQLIEVNPAMARILGYASPQEMVHRQNDRCTLQWQEGYQALLATVRQCGEHRRYQTELIRKNGDTIWVEFQAQPFYAESGIMSHIDGLLSDITEKKRLYEELTRLAHRDELTGIFNRRRFTEILHQEIRRARQGNGTLALIMIDVDFFKSVNDRFGHDTGDKVLQRITAACQNVLRGKDVFGRLGGEEFAVILPEVNQAEAEQIAERLRQSVESEAIRACRETIHITISIGMCHLGEGFTGLSALLKAADKALYRAKQKGRNQVCIY